jgi:type IV pilus assembly protein PilQ
MNSLHRRCWSGVLVIGVAILPCVSPVLMPRSAHSRDDRSAQLQVRRQGNSVFLVVVGVGSRARLIKEKRSPLSWEGRIVSTEASGLSSGLQQLLSMPTDGLDKVMLVDAGDDYILRVVPDEKTTLSAPQISSNGQDLIIRFDGLTAGPPGKTTALLDLRRPGRVLQQRVAPPLRQRAVAPPLGDMAIGTMLISNRSFVNVSGPPVTLTLKDAPAKDALMSLARLGGYGFILIDQDESASDTSTARPVTLAFQDEPFDRALNSVLLASGLQGKLDGRTLLIGTAISSKTFGPQMSKVFRLNQSDAEEAGNYLATLGVAKAGSESSIFPGPLFGLIGTVDARLNTVTLIGDSRLIAVAQSYLRQIDLRTRQVAVKIQILDVSLDKDKSIDSSFSARLGDEAYIVSNSGTAHMNFGNFKPGTPAATGFYGSGVSGEPGVYLTKDPLVELQPEVLVAKKVWVPGSDGSAGGFEEVFDANGQPIYVQRQPVYGRADNPSRYRQPNNSFYSYLESVITSTSTKTLSQPTLLIQEGQKAEVETGTSVVTGVSETERENGNLTFVPTRENAGLKVDVEVFGIDDNGFVALEINPEISVALPTGDVSGGYSISNISKRELKSGQVRLRDGQSLVLTGVISDSDREVAKKWPILGDLPLIGQLFRKSTSARLRNELVIIVTPRILDDTLGGSYGYNYKPGTEAARQTLHTN